MKTLIFLSAILSSSLFAASQADLQAVVETHACLTKLKLELQEYKQVPSYYLKTDSDKRPLESVFTNLQNLQEEYFKTLMDWRESYNKEANDLAELGNLISSLHQTTPLTEKLQGLMKDEESLLRLVHVHETISKERIFVLNKALENCSSNADLVNTLKNNLESFKERLTQIKAVIGASQSKRNLFVEAAKKAIALELETKYAQKAKMDLTELSKKLSSLKLAMNLNTEMDNYYRALTQAKFSYSTLLNIYLQYETPLAIIRSGISKGEEFRKRIDELALTPDAKIVMIKNLEQYLAPLTRALTDTLKGGVEAKLTRQKFMAGEYKKVGAQLAPTCLPVISTFENSPTEQNYAAIVDICKKAVVR